VIFKWVVTDLLHLEQIASRRLDAIELPRDLPALAVLARALHLRHFPVNDSLGRENGRAVSYKGPDKFERDVIARIRVAGINRRQ